MIRGTSSRSQYLIYGISILALAMAIWWLLSGERGYTRPAEIRDVPPRDHSMEARNAAPDFTLELMEGGTAKLSDYAGKVVILDFWATWCPPCKAEIPDFIALQNEYGRKGVQMIGVALDEPAAVRQFARQAGINYPVLFGTSEVALLYGEIQGIPTTFIIDQKGNIVAAFEGYRERSVFEAEIQKLL